MKKFCAFISEKGRLEGTSEICEKSKVQREQWPVPSNGLPLYKLVKFFFKNVYDFKISPRCFFGSNLIF